MDFRMDFILMNKILLPCRGLGYSLDIKISIDNSWQYTWSYGRSDFICGSFSFWHCLEPEIAQIDHRTSDGFWIVEKEHWDDYNE